MPATTVKLGFLKGNRLPKHSYLSILKFQRSRKTQLTCTRCTTNTTADLIEPTNMFTCQPACSMADICFSSTKSVTQFYCEETDTIIAQPSKGVLCPLCHSRCKTVDERLYTDSNTGQHTKNNHIAQHTSEHKHDPRVLASLVGRLTVFTVAFSFFALLVFYVSTGGVRRNVVLFMQLVLFERC